MNFNALLFKAINGFAYKSTLLDKTMIVFSKYIYLLFIVALGVLYIYGLYRKNERVRCICADTFAITVINLCLSLIIGIFYYTPRPFVTGEVNLLMYHVADASFPSDHAIGTMSIAIGINNYNKVYGKILIILSCLVGISRIYVGHHYPMDVMGGYLIVLTTNYLYSKVLRDKVEYIYLKAEKLLSKYMPETKVRI